MTRPRLTPGAVRFAAFVLAPPVLWLAAVAVGVGVTWVGVQRRCKHTLDP